jgi:hypothetical protein
VKPVTIGADDPIDEALRTMNQHRLRRLPEIDGDPLVGIVCQAEVARRPRHSRRGELVAALSRSARNNGRPITDLAQLGSGRGTVYLRRSAGRKRACQRSNRDYEAEAGLPNLEDHVNPSSPGAYRTQPWPAADR